MDPILAPTEPQVAPLTGVSGGASGAIGIEAGQTDLLALLLGAHWVVQAVMVVLACAVFVVATVLVHKLIEFAIARRRLSAALRLLRTARGLPELAVGLAGARGPAPEMARLALAELQLAEAEAPLRRGAQDRTRAGLLRLEAEAVRRLRIGTGVLASIGAIAPFVGLFGTVFGILNSFLAIAEAKTTSLVVVAPGIAEALLATAIGLVAAIPAVLVYNLLIRRLAVYRQRLGDLSTGIDRLQSLSLDRMEG